MSSPRTDWVATSSEKSVRAGLGVDYSGTNEEGLRWPAPGARDERGVAEEDVRVLDVLPPDRLHDADWRRGQREFEDVQDELGGEATGGHTQGVLVER